MERYVDRNLKLLCMPNFHKMHRSATTLHDSQSTFPNTNFTGNDCIFEYNALSNLCYEVTDSGAFYSGRSWIDRGNVIRYSNFSNIQTTEKIYLGSPSVQAIYLDDQVRL